MSQLRFKPAEPVEPADLVRLLAAGLRVEPGPRTRGRVTYLDTFDWLLYDAGARLTREGEGERLGLWWQPGAQEPARQLPMEQPVRFVADLPSGWLRDAVAPLVGVRALLPVGEVAVRRQLLRAVDRDGNVSLRVWWEEVEPLDSEGRPAEAAAVLVRLESVAGGEAELAAALDLLGTGLTARTAPVDDLEVAAAARGRRPGDYSVKPRLRLARAEPAGHAVRLILGGQLAVVRANLDGVCADLDSEFLHDLRVAVRRTRAALVMVSGLLPGDQLALLGEELRWLGSATGPCRDLDVFLLELERLQGRLRSAPAAALAPLGAAVASERARVKAELVDTLRSSRCAALLETWSGAAGGGGTMPAEGRRPIRELADRHVESAFRRVVKRGRRLGSNPPPEPLHRVRIAAKKLRYLVELLRSLYPEGAVGALLHELKRLQELLGGVQDSVVMLRRLDELAGRLHPSGRLPTGSVLAAGRLAGLLEARQDELRSGFAERFAAFAGADARAALAAMLAGREEG